VRGKDQGGRFLVGRSQEMVCRMGHKRTSGGSAQSGLTGESGREGFLQERSPILSELKEKGKKELHEGRTWKEREAGKMGGDPPCAK